VTQHTGMACPRAATDSVLYVAGEMAGGEAAAYARHVEVCPTCAAAVAAGRAAEAWLHGLPVRRLRGETREALSMAARAFVAERARRASIRERRVVWLPRWQPALGWALAATLLLVAGNLFQTPSEMAPVTPSAALLTWDYGATTARTTGESGDLLPEFSHDPLEVALGTDLLAVRGEVDRLAENIDDF